MSLLIWFCVCIVFLLSTRLIVGSYVIVNFKQNSESQKYIYNSLLDKIEPNLCCVLLPV